MGESSDIAPENAASGMSRRTA